MTVRLAAATVLSLAFLASAAQAQERDYCPDRPGLDTPACTMAPGTASLEIGLSDWTLDKDRDQRQDTVLIADTLLRYGIADHAEVQVGWTTLGFARTRDRATGETSHRSGTGDVVLALRRNIANPDGSGLSAAVMPFVSIPIGRDPFGGGDWGAGVRMPLTYELSDSWSVMTTTEFDAAVDEDGHGRHFAFDEVVGASLTLTKALSATLEYEILVDHDPAGRHVEHVSALSLAWKPAANLQLDLGANAGLDRDAPDAEVYFGVSRRF